MKIKCRNIILGFCLILVLVKYCNADTSDRIKGIAEFLVKRANENIIQIFEKKIKDNPLISEYFPNTSRVLKTLNLKLLMLNKSLWEYNVEKDLKTITTLLTNRLKQTGIDLLANDKYNKLMDLQKYFEDNKAKPETVAMLSKLYKDIDVNLKAIKLDELADKESLKIAQLLVRVDIIDKIPPLISLIKNQIENTKESQDMINTLLELKEDFIGMEEALSYIESIYDTELSYTNRMTHVFFLIEKLGNFEEIIKRQSNSYMKFKYYALFFSQLSDANNSTDAQVVLETFALPATSFIAKREDNMRFSISSYLGLAAGIETEESAYYNYYGIAAPIGLELCWGINQKSSIGILLSMFDFGTAVNSQLYETAETFGFEDIVAPGIFLVYGLPDLPLSIGMGGCKVQGLRSNSSAVRGYMFIAVDMPLFALTN